jgi:hypothetical protein
VSWQQFTFTLPTLMQSIIYFQTLTADLSAFFEHFHDHGRLVRHSPAHIYHSEDSKIPGIEGRDYPSYNDIPETGFTCGEHRQKDKMYADRRTRCQVRGQNIHVRKCRIIF